MSNPPQSLLLAREAVHAVLLQALCCKHTMGHTAHRRTCGSQQITTQHMHPVCKLWLLLCLLPPCLICFAVHCSATQQQLSAAQAALQSHQQQLADLTARLSEAEGRAAAAQAAAAGLGTAELKVMLSSLQDQLQAQKAELAAARKVKHEADAAARLQQELLVAKQEAAGAVAALAQLKEQHRSSEELREEVDRWRLLFKVCMYVFFRKGVLRWHLHTACSGG